MFIAQDDRSCPALNDVGEGGVVWHRLRPATVATAEFSQVVVVVISDDQAPAVTLFPQIVHGQWQQSLRALLQAIVIGLVEFVVHDADGNGCSADPEQCHASRQPEGKAQGDRGAPLHAFTW